MSNSKPVRTLFLFCEGPHDIEFVSKVMKHCLSFSKVEWKFSEYPAPLNKIFRKSVNDHAAQDMTRNMAYKFFLPDRIYVKENLVVLLFNSGGKTHDSKVREFLSKTLVLLEEDAKHHVYDPIVKKESEYYIDEAKYLFLYDADDWGLEKTATECVSWFGMIDDEIWMEDNWQFHDDYPFAATCDNKALYVLGETPDRGTLEDWLHPLFTQKNSGLLQKAEAAIDDMFEWNPVSDSLEHTISIAAKRKKSILTFAGQRKKPGSSMSVILGQADMFRNNDFKENDYVKPFASFIEGFMTAEPNENEAGEENA